MFASQRKWKQSENASNILSTWNMYLKSKLALKTMYLYEYLGELVHDYDDFLQENW